MKTIKIGVISLLVFTICLGGGYLYLSWVTPLGPGLDSAVPTSMPESSLPTLDPAAQEASQLSTFTPAPLPTPTIVPVCGGPTSMTILLSGVASEGYLYGLADAIRVVQVDFQSQTVSVLAFPRDLWVDIPGISDHGISQGKLNQAYFYGTEGMGFFDGSGYGSGLLAETLREDFGVRIDHYLAVNLSAFRDIVDTMGGIDVYFSQPVYIKSFEKPKLYLRAGNHHLAGKQAENVVRTRIESGDLGRIQQQTVVLKAVAAKMLTPSGYQNIPNWIQLLKNSVLTDLSPAEITQLVCLGEKLDPEQDIKFYNIPKDKLREDWIYDPYLDYQPSVLLYDQDDIRRMVASVFNYE
jgi:polyisoprenyl-teichoic acid--peptidoglycan teichoic acid transferase